MFSEVDCCKNLSKLKLQVIGKCWFEFENIEKKEGLVTNK